MGQGSGVRSRESGVGKGTLVGDAGALDPSPGKQTLVQQLSVQLKGAQGIAPAAVHQAASAGIATPSTSLPHGGRIQELFGPAHNVGAIQAHVGGGAEAACNNMGASAFAAGNHVAFAKSPDLHTAAHEAAHVVQQAKGVNLYGGVGAAGDTYERHADAVADRVVAGQSAADLLGAGPSGSGGAAVQREEKPAADADPAAAAKPGDAVTTSWYVDYNVPGGKTKSLPQRKGDDQMIIDQLKVDSHNRGPKDKPTFLHGGNAAHAGRAYIGDAQVPKGGGEVSASVRYAKRSEFKVDVTITPAAKTAAEKAALKQVQADISKLVMEEIESRGDYEALATEAQKQYQPQFDGKTLKVSVTPVGARTQATEQVAAQAAEFNAVADSTYVALIDPTGTQDTSVGWTASEGSEDGGGTSAGVGTKSTVEVGDSSKVALKTRIVTEFQNSLKTNVEGVFKKIQGTLDSGVDQSGTSHEGTFSWKAGIDPAKEKKEGEADKKKDDGGGGIIDKIEDTVSSGAKWLYNKGKGAVMKIPLVGDALSIAGDIWDGISGRGKVEIEKKSTDGSSGGHTQTHTENSGTEITSLASIATELTSKMISETATEIERIVSRKVGLEVSTNAQVNKSNKKIGSHGSSGTVITHEVGKPQVLIKKIK